LKRLIFIKCLFFDKKANSFEAAFNMADALYKQKKYDEALEQFSALAKQETDKERLGEIYHNIGNTLLAMEKTDEIVEAYKNSLRNRPASEQTKYNLEFARHKQQQDQQNQDQNKDQNLIIFILLVFILILTVFILLVFVLILLILILLVFVLILPVFILILLIFISAETKSTGTESKENENRKRLVILRLK